MNKVECHVDNCRHYSNNLCSLDKIKVDGPAAKEKSQTCCLSFAERNNSMENSTAAADAAPDTGIHCKADNCTYNSASKCNADNVTVGCVCAGVTSKSGTECSTFQER